MPQPFKAYTLVGLCYVKGPHIHIQSEGEEWNLHTIMDSLEGREARYLFQYLPETPDPSAWGLGSCRWQPSLECPANHGEHPNYMLDFHGKGVVSKSPQGRYGSREGQSFRRYPLRVLNGHRCRVAFVTAFESEPESEFEGLSSIEGLLKTALDAQEKLEEIKKALGGLE